MRSINITCKILSLTLLFGTLFAIGTFGQQNSRFSFRSSLSINPTSVNFGSLSVGAISNAMAITLTNQSFSSITVTKVGLSLSQVTYSGPALPATLGPGQTIRAALIFIPNAEKYYSGTLQVIESNGRIASARVTGTGVAVQAQGSTSGSTSLASSGSTSSLSSGSAQLHLSSLSLAFGDAILGNSVGQSVTVSNTGTASLTILSVVLSGSGFSVSGVSSGQILAPGQSANLAVAFLPLVSGNLSGGVTVTTDVAGSATISLSGSGSSQPTVTSIVLTWTPSASSSVAGYNVYRAASPGGEVGTNPINGTMLVPGTTYTDSNVAGGVTYYYAVTAVTASDVESADSNEASALTP